MSSVKTFYITKNTVLSYYGIYENRPKAFDTKSGDILWDGDMLLAVYYLDKLFPKLSLEAPGIEKVEVEEHEDCYVLRRVV